MEKISLVCCCSLLVVVVGVAAAAAAAAVVVVVDVVIVGGSRLAFLLGRFGHQGRQGSAMNNNGGSNQQQWRQQTNAHSKKERSVPKYCAGAQKWVWEPSRSDPPHVQEPSKMRPTRV